MSGYGKPGFIHLNAANLWPGFARQGLELGADGVLRLFCVPRLAGPLPMGIETLPAPDGPEGLVAAEDGTLFYSDSIAGRVTRAQGCEPSPRGVACHGPLAGIRALGYLALRRLLLVGDTAGGRVLLFDPDTLLTAHVWPVGQPVSIAADAADNAYVVDGATHRVEKFDRTGERVPAFGDNVTLADPIGVAASDAGVFVLDAASKAVYQFDAQGASMAVFAQGALTSPLGLACAGDALYVGDNAARRVLKFSLTDATLRGEATAYHGPVAALAVSAGTLWVLAGGGTAPLPLTLDAGSVSMGMLWGPAKAPFADGVAWHNAHATVASTPGGHIQFFVAPNGPAPARPSPENSPHPGRHAALMSPTFSWAARKQRASIWARDFRVTAPARWSSRRCAPASTRSPISTICPPSTRTVRRAATSCCASCRCSRASLPKTRPPLARCPRCSTRLRRPPPRCAGWARGSASTGRRIGMSIRSGESSARPSTGSAGAAPWTGCAKRCGCSPESTP
jgi:hypothetical protein